ncbi:hypothetical protein K1T71_008484 [Dendrolimus kikuchii]|uniref:Uncharacterized protein n=1 Tax=Dendrolimus kikuchii TaxID=765133 RepID=A0ACC1CXC4_9NEOP|nr:hypothetical protein K1T71_008484 [Dendrolimus kikuchii]
MLFVGLAVIIVACLCLYFSAKKPKNFPPGPSWIPVLGCAIKVNNVRKRTGYLYKAIYEMTKEYSPDGHLLGLKIGKDKIIIVNSLKATKEMLLNEFIDGRPRGIFYQTRTSEERRGVTLTDGEFWKEQRRFLVRHLKDFGFGRSGMNETAISEGKHMVKDVLKMINDSGQNSVILEMHNFFSVYTLNTLWSMMAGKRYDANDPNMKVLKDLLFDLFATIDMVGAIFSYFPILSVITPTLSGYKDFVEIHRRIIKFLQEEIARHKETFEPENENKDFMDAYLRVLTEKGEVGTYSEGQLVALCMDMFMAGTETTAKSMSFCFSYLVRQQEVQKKAQEEIDRVIGRDRPPNFIDRANMPYNEAIVHESIRHFLGRGFSVPHRALSDTTLVGYKIPEDTMVINNFSNIMMDEKYFPDPHAFNPERFLVDGRLVLPDHYFPFGLGKRRCLGDGLAKCNIFVFTTTMLQQFSFLPAPGEPLPSLEHVDGATPSAAPFKTLVLPRFKNSL